MQPPRLRYRTADWHCHTLASALRGIDMDGLLPAGKRRRRDATLTDASEWLQLAAEIKDVSLQYMGDPMEIYLCESAGEYDSAKAKIQAEFVTRIARFSFAWNAFEATIKALNVPAHPEAKNSVAKAATWFIKKNGVRTADFPGYLHLLKHAVGLAKVYPDLQDVILPPEKDRLRISEAGYGVELCREMRNKLAHGAAMIPEPEGWRWGSGFRDKEMLALINILVKLLLITIQMMVFIRLGPKMNALTEDLLLYDESGPDLLEYFRHIHIDLPTYQKILDGDEQMEPLSQVDWGDRCAAAGA